MSTFFNALHCRRSTSNEKEDEIQQVNTDTHEQMRILKDDYDGQRLVFDRMRGEHLETITAYNALKQSDLFHELRDACQLLEFQVAQLEYVKNEIQRPKVIVVEEQTSRKQEMFHVHIPQNDNHHGISISDAGNATEDTRSASYLLHYFRSFFCSDNLKNDVIISDNLTEECPTCSMAFPANMTKNAIEHYILMDTL
jgi:hypothetical protein